MHSQPEQPSKCRPDGSARLTGLPPAYPYKFAPFAMPEGSFERNWPTSGSYVRAVVVQRAAGQLLPAREAVWGLSYFLGGGKAARTGQIRLIIWGVYGR